MITYQANNANSAPVCRYSVVDCVLLLSGLFLNNRREKMARQELTGPYLERVWRKQAPTSTADELPGAYLKNSVLNTTHALYCMKPNWQ